MAGRTGSGSGDCNVPQGHPQSNNGHIAADDVNDFVHFFPQSGQLACICRIPLSFKDDRHEKSFRAGRESRLDAYIRCISIVAVVGTLFGMLIYSPDMAYLNAPVRTARFVIASIVLVFSAVFAFKPSWTRQLSGEHTLALYVLFITIFVYLMSKPRLAFLFGLRQLDAWPHIESPVTSDSGTIAYLCLLIAFTHGAPVRCRKCFLNLILQPVLYVAFTAPLPGIELEYSSGRRLRLAFQLLIMVVLCFVLQSNAELAERRTFILKELFRNGYIQEKVLRFDLEHKAEAASASTAECIRDSSNMPVRRSECDTQSATECSSVFFGAAANVRQFYSSTKEFLEDLKTFGRCEKWLLDSESLQILPGRVLGFGGFAMAAIGRMHGTRVAVKIPLSLDIAKRMKGLANELRHLRSLRHPCIVAFHGVCVDVDAEELVLVEEFVDGRTLGSIISPPPRGPAEWIRHRILLDSCAAVNYMHHHTPVVVHGDLKPADVLVEALTFRPKLIDFGLSKRYGKGDKMTGGTPRWMAPEVLVSAAPGVDKSLAAPSADVFSIGALAFFIVTGTKPFHGVSPAECVELAQRGEGVELEWPESEVSWFSRCRELTKACTRFDPLQRPTTAEVHACIESWVSGCSPAGLGDCAEAPVHWLDALAKVRGAVEHQDPMQPNGGLTKLSL